MTVFEPLHRQLFRESALAFYDRWGGDPAAGGHYPEGSLRKRWWRIVIGAMLLFLAGLGVFGVLVRVPAVASVPVLLGGAAGPRPGLVVAVFPASAAGLVHRGTAVQVPAADGKGTVQVTVSGDGPVMTAEQIGSRFPALAEAAGLPGRGVLAEGTAVPKLVAGKGRIVVVTAQGFMGGRPLIGLVPLAGGAAGVAAGWVLAAVLWRGATRRLAGRVSRGDGGRHRAALGWLRPGRVPVVLSDTMTECGAACLAMVLQYFGRQVTVGECAKRCFVSRDGASALAVANAARAFRLQVTPYRAERLDDLAKIARPAILYWAFNHFVVLEKFRGANAVIVDPARGRVVVDRQELDENFTGVALSMTPGPQFRPGGARPSSPGWAMTRRALRAPGAGRLTFRILLTSVLLTGLGLIGPAVTTILIDQVIPAGQHATLAALALGVALVAVSRTLAGLARGLLLVDLADRVDQTLSASFFGHLLRLPYSFFQNHSVGDLISRMAASSQLRMVLTQNVLSGVVDGILVIVYATVLFVLSPIFGLITAGFGLVQILLVVLPARRITQLTVAELSESGKTSGFAAEALRGIDSVKAAGNETWAFGRWQALHSRQLAVGARRARLAAVVSVGMTAAADTAALVLPLLAGWQVLSGRLSVGAMFGLIALATSFSGPLTRLTVSVQQLQGAQGSLRRLATILVTPAEQADRPRRPAPSLSGSIELAGVGLRHPGAASWTVRHINVAIPAGAQIAFVGPSGSGKSTLVKMILGLYTPTEGTVLLDGHNLADLDLQAVRRQCGVVTQEAAVFDGTIRQNIAFGTDLPLADVRRAAQLADLERDIAAMPMGYETRVSENGSALSGGQCQRLALARALARRPAILILDEATSALDTITETNIARNLANVGITTITVAHRLSTIRNADTIVVFDKGSIAEIGDHHGLTAAGGLYAAMAATTETPA